MFEKLQHETIGKNKIRAADQRASGPFFQTPENANPQPAAGELYMSITFTAAEKSELAKAITKAACGIAECWDILSRIGDRIGRDWDPEGTSVADIAEHNASDLDNPAAIECLDADCVAEYFEDEENWKRP
jgi:hypothetical protein